MARRRRALAQTLYTWIAAGPFHADVAFRIDALSAVMVLIVTGRRVPIHVYSVGYMGHDESCSRFFAYLNLFMFAMLLLVLATTCSCCSSGWEGVGLCSYLLIGFWYAEDAERRRRQEGIHREPRRRHGASCSACSC
jgi:NADH-quinone oxidoreductase subunit L